ncbi:hypothetical protein FA95DRAFT_1534014 [Auriscalpium vulgare]|uniref:Uncharacterized protein n=1 Tax=Auriscalpium vulgare TaxID=40419 RepID=A0ACB8S6J0_9AGAM|nr:hypothetical protein FA95DRAFT_1534014 [Auriscalpium vulgare]
METSGHDFTSLATLQLPPHSRLLPSACCPDKDLVVVITRTGGKDRMSLWKMQGSKKWDVDVDSGAAQDEEIVDLAWSPDGQSIVLVHHPPRTTFHSIQDGRQERDGPVFPDLPLDGRFCGVWWLPQEKPAPTSNIPDILKRGPNIPGSAHSILKMLPLLDPVKDDTQALTSTDLFAFQGFQTSAAPKANVPAAIASWPVLPPDFLAASIQHPVRAGGASDLSAEELSDINVTTVNSILAVADTNGRLYCFLDGNYPLGVIEIQAQSRTTSLYHDSKAPVLFAHLSSGSGTSSSTTLRPVPIELSLLRSRIPRDVARVSSTARELLWYTMRVVDEMRVAWFGSDSQMGGRDPGIKWLQTLEGMQPTRAALTCPADNKRAWSLVDLTFFLVSGRSSDPISDFIGSGEQMSERGLQKWETTVVEALVKLRDYAGQRVAPACQRLHLVLEEVLGWSEMPEQYGLCELQKPDILDCLRMTSQAITVADWLSSTARRELARFKEFMKWLRYEIGNGNPTIDPHSLMTPRHDILEVNSYLISGLANNPIDEWFTKGPPTFSPQDLGVPTEKQSLTSVMERARRALQDPARMSLQHRVGTKDLSGLDKNLEALVQNLATRCQAIFFRACSATARSSKWTFDPERQRRMPESALDLEFIIRERRAEKVDQASRHPSCRERTLKKGSTTQGVAVCLFRIHCNHEARDTLDVEVAILDCQSAEGTDSVPLELLDVEFFDEESLVMVSRTRESEGPTAISTVAYADLGYEKLAAGETLGELSREGLVVEALRRWKTGQVPSSRMPIKRSRRLAACGDGAAWVAVNGRAGRRVACVLGAAGVLEVVDLEGDGDESGSEGGGG